MQLNPVVFSDGKAFYEALGKKFIQHDKGLFILAPSGVGKTHFCTNQKVQHWIDGDELWIGAGAQPPFSEKYWTKGVKIINQVEQRSDVITMEAKLQGFWIMGASCYWFQPDAIVIPDWETHKAFIKHRETNNYDGGATSDALQQVLNHIEVIKDWHDKHGVPKFASIEDAVNSLSAELQ
jgi:hypothetical protein